MEHHMKFSASYGISVGALIILQWIFFLATGSVPELQTARWEIGFHISVELLLAFALLIGGVATLSSKGWGEKILLVALGMAIYSEINSPGYFAELGQWALVAMFAFLLFGATISVVLLLKQREEK
jgi:hypothetical protein